MTLPLCRYIDGRNGRLKRLLNCGIVWPVWLLGVLVRWNKVCTVNRAVHYLHPPFRMVRCLYAFTNTELHGRDPWHTEYVAAYD